MRSETDDGGGLGIVALTLIETGTETKHNMSPWMKISMSPTMRTCMTEQLNSSQRQTERETSEPEPTGRSLLLLLFSGLSRTV